MKRLIIACLASISCIFGFAQNQPNFKIATTSFKKDTVLIVKFGAISNGDFLNTHAINSAIDFMHKKGGGVVVIPKGQWVTGPIVLKSNVNLHLNSGALLVFTSDFSQYPLVVSSFEGVDAARCQSPISAEKQTNIAITGQGIINGNGMYWRPLKKEKLSDAEWKRHLQVYGGALTEDKKTWYPSKAAVDASKSKDIGKLVDGKKLQDFENIKDFLRPNMLRINGCSKVLVEGVTFENSPAWTTHFLMSDNITINGMKVKNPWWGTNTDAIDLESCSNAILENCVFDTGDDGITIKSGRDEDGRKRGMPTQNIIVKNCTVYHAHGGFVIGSEMSGGAKNIYISDCTFIGSDIGLRFKTVRGRGGVVENIYAKNVNMKDIVGEAILFDMYYAAVDPIKLNNEEGAKIVVEKFPVTEATPQFQHFYFDNINCDGASKAVFVRGLPEMQIKDVNLDHLFIKSRQGVQIEEANGVVIKNSTILTKEVGSIVSLKNAENISIDTIALKRINAKTTRLAEKFAATAMHLWPDSFSVKPGGKARWSYDQGVILRGIESLWNTTGDVQYFKYLQNAMDYYVKEDGSIYDYKPEDFNLDHLNNGKLLLTLYQVTGKEKYKKAIDQLHAQIQSQPRNTLGGFWHKKIYPNQMWLDGLYMGAAFYAQYAHGIGVETAGAGIDADGEAGRAAGPRHEALDHLQRWIVHRVKPGILQGAQDRGLPRTGQAADQHDGQAGAAHRAKAPVCWVRRPSAQSSASATTWAAEGARGSSMMRGRPVAGSRRGAGRRGAPAPSLTARARRAGAPCGRRSSPSPRTSSNPASSAGGDAIPSTMSTLSSAISTNPRSSSRNARSDLPDPAGPSSRSRDHSLPAAGRTCRVGAAMIISSPLR
jgi:polygalacturonase